MTQASLARRLRVLRAERGLTQERAAQLAGVAAETLSDLERGKRRAYTPTLAKIARGYGVPVEELVEEEPAPLGEAASREPGPTKVRLGDVLSELLLAEVEAEHDRLSAALEAGELSAAFYTRRMADLYGSMIAMSDAAERTSREASREAG